VGGLSLLSTIDSMKGENIVCFGEILWDNLKEGRRLGGAPLNVCYHLNKLGVNSTIVTQVGSDPNGMDILKELKTLGIDSRYCTVNGTKPTSTVEVVVGEQGDIRYDIVEDVAWDDIVCTPHVEHLVADSDALVFGSLVTRSAISRETLFQLIKKSKFRVFDVNLRSPFYTKELICSLLEMANLLKLNEEEMVIISDWLAFPQETLHEQMEHMQRCFPNIQEIILTRGSQGAIYFSDTERLKVKAHPVRVQDTVGSGDAFLAAFLAYKMKGTSIQTALQQASVLSSFVASQSGACPIYDPKDLLTIG